MGGEGGGRVGIKGGGWVGGAGLAWVRGWPNVPRPALAGLGDNSLLSRQETLSAADTTAMRLGV